MAPSRVAVASAPGLVRARNEDSAYTGHWLCAVADGMGGHASGDVASATVIDAIRQFDAITGVEQLTTVLGSAVRAANAQLTAKAEDRYPLAGMGSTLTAMLWSGRHLAVAHIGDSRAYLLRDRVLRQITEDHVLPNLVATPMPASIGGYLVRYLDARPGWSPDLTLRAVRPGDRYLICSDGLNGFADPDAIREYWPMTVTPTRQPRTDLAGVRGRRAGQRHGDRHRRTRRDLAGAGGKPARVGAAAELASMS